MDPVQVVSEPPNTPPLLWGKMRVIIIKCSHPGMDAGALGG